MNSKTRMNRRKFLKRSVGITSAACGFPYLVRSSALGKDGQTAPSNRIVLGSIGVGGMGKGDMKSLMRAKGVQVVAVCDVVEKRRKEAKSVIDDNNKNNDCKMYSDFRDLLAQDDIFPHTI